MERKRYPSDITREQYESIRLLLESGKNKTRPREVDLYDVFCAVLYVLKNACTWRSLPHDLPRWDRVYKYFQYWGGKPSQDQPSLLEQALKKSGERGAYRAWTARKNEFLHYRCAKREEHGHGATERL
jgi:transposase